MPETKTKEECDGTVGHFPRLPDLGKVGVGAQTSAKTKGKTMNNVTRIAVALFGAVMAVGMGAQGVSATLPPGCGSSPSGMTCPAKPLSFASADVSTQRIGLVEISDGKTVRLEPTLNSDFARGPGLEGATVWFYAFTEPGSDCGHVRPAPFEANGKLADALGAAGPNGAVNANDGMSWPVGSPPSAVIKVQALVITPTMGIHAMTLANTGCVELVPGCQSGTIAPGASVAIHDLCAQQLAASTVAASPPPAPSPVVAAVPPGTPDGQSATWRVVLLTLLALALVGAGLRARDMRAKDRQS